jgi:hypothetical protein
VEKLLYFYCFALLRHAAQAISGGRPMGTGTSLVVVRHAHPPPFHRSISAKRVWVCSGTGSTLSAAGHVLLAAQGYLCEWTHLPLTMPLEVRWRRRA